MHPFEVVGDVLGDVMGGYYDEGVGAGPAQMQPPHGHWRHGGRHPASMVPVSRPSWRGGQLAPGVMAPDEGMVPLGMKPDAGTPPGTFALATQNMNFVGRLQKPFRAERLLVSTVRNSTTAVGRLLGQFFVGVDLNQATLQGVDVELYGAATAFGTRLTLLQAPPGVEITVPIVIAPALTGTDTIFATIQWSGRIVH